MSPWTAQRMGATVGAALALTGVVWLRTRATPCPGAVTLEFHPPLADPGSYLVRLSWAGAKPCEFSVRIPLGDTSKDRRKLGCGMAVQLRTQVQSGSESVTGLTFAAAPERFKLELRRDGEALYDTDLVPQYAPYATRRAEDSHFCGERALVLPACLRGSSACAPFPASCDGPEDCAPKGACCLTPEWGREFGPRAASECTAQSSCFAHLGHVACHSDADCPADMRCADPSWAADFSAAVSSCQNR